MNELLKEEKAGGREEGEKKEIRKEQNRKKKKKKERKKKRAESLSPGEYFVSIFACLKLVSVPFSGLHFRNVNR